MATIASTLRMHDQMTNVLQRMTNSMYMTLDAMDSVQNSLDRTFDNSPIETARKSVEDMERTLNNLSAPIDQAESIQDDFNKSLEKGENNAAGLLGKIVGFVGAYAGYKAFTGFMSSALDMANEQIRAEQRLQTIMGNIQGMTQDGIDYVKNYAKEIENATSVASSVGIFGQSQMAQYVYDPENIVALTDSMYNLAMETYGVGFSMEQVMQTGNLMGKVMLGDINALSRNGFNIDKIFTEAEQKLLLTGNEGERAALVIEMIEENLEGLAAAMRNTPEGAINALANQWNNVKTIIGYGLIPIVLQFADMIEANMPFIENLFINVFNVIFNIMERLIYYVGLVADFFVNNWSWIEPIIVGLGVALLALIPILTVLAAKQLIWNMIMNKNPIFFIITLVIGLITALVRLWQTNDKFAAGLMRAWNTLANAQDQFNIGFMKVWYGIVDGVTWMDVQVQKIVQDMINAIIGDINAFIDILNNIPFVSIEAIGEVSFATKAAAELEATRQAHEAKIAEMENNAALKAIEREQNVLDMYENRAAKRAQEAAEREERFSMPDLFGQGIGNGMWDVGDNTLLNVDKVKEVGKIKDKVDISSEDLKLMRELAEMKNIQNFVTLTPTSQFLGDMHIRNESDIETITAKIAEKLSEDIESTVSGVYT